MTDSPATVAQASTGFDALKADAYRRSESLTLIEEMAEKWKTIDSAPWRKSSYSGTNGGDCVEAAEGRILVRDTSDRGGVALSISPDAWLRFTDTVR